MDAEHGSIDGRTELPTDFAAHMAAVSGLDAPPTTLEECWTAFLDGFEELDRTVTLADLYSPTPTRHEVHVDDRVRYAHCAMDALAAAVMEPQETVTARSVDPVSGVPVTFTVEEDSVETSPEGALVCYGSTVDVEDVEAAGSLAAWSVQDDKRAIRDAVCQYTNAFESEATYERWAADTESVTAPLSPPNVVSLMRELVGRVD